MRAARQDPDGWEYPGQLLDSQLGNLLRYRFRAGASPEIFARKPPPRHHLVQDPLKGRVLPCDFSTVEVEFEVARPLRAGVTCATWNKSNAGLGMIQVLNYSSDQGLLPTADATFRPRNTPSSSATN